MSLKLNPSVTALVLIDLQKGIVGMPVAPYGGVQVIEKAVLLGKRFAEVSATLVLVRVAFASNFVDRLKQPVDAPSAMPAGGFPKEFSELVPEIASLPADVIITKRQWGAFYGTELDMQLRRRGITTIVLGGISTNFGVESTAREAWQHNYSVIIAEDACSSSSAEMHQFAVEKIFPRIAQVRSTADILAAL